MAKVAILHTVPDDATFVYFIGYLRVREEFDTQPQRQASWVPKSELMEMVRDGKAKQGSVPLSTRVIAAALRAPLFDNEPIRITVPGVVQLHKKRKETESGTSSKPQPFQVYLTPAKSVGSKTSATTSQNSGEKGESSRTAQERSKTSPAKEIDEGVGKHGAQAASSKTCEKNLLSDMESKTKSHRSEQEEEVERKGKAPAGDSAQEVSSQRAPETPAEATQFQTPPRPKPKGGKRTRANRSPKDTQTRADAGRSPGQEVTRDLVLQTPDQGSTQSKQQHAEYVTPQKVTLTQPLGQCAEESKEKSGSDEVQCTQQTPESVIKIPERSPGRKLDISKGQLQQGSEKEGYWVYVS